MSARDPLLKVDPLTGQAYIEVAGLKVYVADDETCAAAAVVICSDTSFFADDVHAHCATCHCPIVHRPYVPAGPPKMCMRCGSAYAKAEAARLSS